MKNYLSIWRHFNRFIMRLDYIPRSWEKRTALFCAHLIEENSIQSSTLHSYISAIKHIVKMDGYAWKDERVWLDMLVRSCKLINDCLNPWLPIQFGMLELLLFELERVMRKQPYLEILHKAIIALSYYGLMWVGEISDSPHNVKAVNIHVAQNKRKILIISYTSKTNSKANYPQEIKISGDEENGKYKKFFCPFKLLRAYIKARPNVIDNDEPFFIYSDRSPIRADTLRQLLRDLISNLNLQPHLYNFQSLRIGRATDLMKFGFPVEKIKKMGRWKSNVVYKYIRPLY